jgi:hypothetical protein
MGCGLPLQGLGMAAADGGGEVPAVSDAATADPEGGADATDTMARSEGDAGNFSDDSKAGPTTDVGARPGDGGDAAPADAQFVGEPGVDGEGAVDSGPADSEGGADARVFVTPVFVQSSYVTPMSPRQSLNVAYPMAQAAGHLNVVVVGWNDSAAHVTSVSDSVGNLYALAAEPVVYPGFLTQAVYYAADIADAAQNRVVVAFDAPAPYVDLRVLEYGGVASHSPLETAAGASGSGAMATVGPVSTTTTELLVAATTVVTYVTQVSDDFTLRVLTSVDGDSVADRVSTAAGLFGSSVALGAPGAWVMQVVAFRAQ